MNPHEARQSCDEAEPLDLIVRYLDHAITREEANRLDEMLLRDTSVRLLFRELCLQALVISERERGTLTEDPLPPSRRPVTRTLFAITAIAAALMIVVLILSRGATTIGHFREIEGDVCIEGDSGDRVAKRGQAVVSEVTVRIRGLSSSASFEFLDGTRLTLAGGTTVTLRDAGQKKVTLQCGNLGASVKPQPRDRPMLILTPHARVEVLGTRLNMAALAHGTAVGVVEGRVAACDVSGGGSVVVGEREFAVTDGRSQMVTKALPLPPLECNWTFDRGSPDGWNIGRFNAPEGTMAAIRMNAREGAKALHEVASGVHWTRGVFLVSERSVITFRYRFRRPGPFYLMIGTRSEDKHGPATGNFEIYDRKSWEIPSGTWRTARIPVRSLRRTLPPRVAPRQGLVAYFIAFNTLYVDRGLEIDWVRVTRDSAGSAPR